MNKDEKLQITKEKLLYATEVLMNSMGDPLLVTSREIAAAAEVKPAMINYCFGSRENLIYQVFQKQYVSFLQGTDVEKILASNLPPKEVLKELHFIVCRCLLDNFNFTKAITGFVLFKRDLSKESFSFPYVYKHYHGTKSEQECKLIAYELSTTMQLMIYRKDAMKEDFGIDFSDEKVLRETINLRVDLLLGDCV